MLGIDVAMAVVIFTAMTTAGPATRAFCLQALEVFTQRTQVRDLPASCDGVHLQVCPAYDLPRTTFRRCRSSSSLISPRAYRSARTRSAEVRACCFGDRR
jgi:hypothetical protein